MQYKRDIKNVDIPGAFIKADMNEIVHLKMEGRLVKLIVKTPSYIRNSYVWKLEGPMYVKHIKGSIWSPSSSYAILEISDCEACDHRLLGQYIWWVENKVINWRQITILWYVDDLKVSHVWS